MFVVGARLKPLVSGLHSSDDLGFSPPSSGSRRRSCSTHTPTPSAQVSVCSPLPEGVACGYLLRKVRQVGAAGAEAAAQPDMIKSLSVSSEGSLPPLEDDVDSVCSDELLGSQSRRWLAELMTADMPPESGAVNTVGRDGLFVDYHFPLGELEMKADVRWKRPKVTTEPLKSNEITMESKYFNSSKSITCMYVCMYV